MVNEVFAIRYGTRARTRAQTFYEYDTYREPDGPLELSFYFWVVRHDAGVVVFDTGYSDAAARRHGRTEPFLVEPVAALRALGIDVSDVTHVVVSHAHWDHTGNVDKFPTADVVVQSAELDFWTSRHAEEDVLRAHLEREDIDFLRSLEATGRLRLVSGDLDIVPGVRSVVVGGHTPGQVILIVDTPRGDVVLASDSLHMYEEMERRRPFHAFTDLPDSFDAYSTLQELQDHGAVIVAGHDPLVMERFPLVEGTDFAVRVS